MITTIIFDNDGVLVDTERLFFAANCKILADSGIELTLDYYLDVALRRGQSCLEIARQRGFDDDGLDVLRRQRDLLYKELLAAESTEREGVYEVLEALKTRCRFGVVTSNPRPHFDLIHRRTRIVPYLDFIYTQEDSPRFKPHPDPYSLALARQSLQAKECLVVEDSERGVLSAVAAGIRCIAAPTALTRGGNFESAWRVIEDLREIVSIIHEVQHADRG